MHYGKDFYLVMVMDYVMNQFNMVIHQVDFPITTQITIEATINHISIIINNYHPNINQCKILFSPYDKLIN